jgi:hypothetical protein
MTDERDVRFKSRIAVALKTTDRSRVARDPALSSQPIGIDGVKAILGDA